ncbi:hypothetical protein ES703_105477 [subsurface metagenome]
MERRDETISELSRDELKRLIGEAVEEKLIEVLGDPDEGMILREEVQARLRRTLAAECAEAGGVLIEDVAARLGLEW